MRRPSNEPCGNSSGFSRFACRFGFFRGADRRLVRSRGTLMSAPALAIMAALTSAPASAAGPSSPTAHDISVRLHAATPASPVDLTGSDLERLDLAGLDFKAARLARTNLFGADLTGANLAHTDLSGAKLDRITLIGTNFDAARLDGASLLRPSAFSGLTPSLKEAPTFRAASMRGIRLFGRFSGSDFTGADMTGATCAPFGKTGFIENIWRTEFSGAKLAGARIVGANLTNVLLSFADLRNADLRDAILKDADLTGADLSGADVTGLDVTGADLAGVKLTGARGIDTMKGINAAKNAGKLIR